jgi:hypothetical protein
LRDSTHYIGYIPLDLYQRSGGARSDEIVSHDASDEDRARTSVAGRIFLNQAETLII